MLTNWGDFFIYNLRFAGEAVSYLDGEVGGERHILQNLWIPYLGIWTFHFSEKDVNGSPSPARK